jgi:hypothetical protein
MDHKPILERRASMEQPSVFVEQATFGIVLHCRCGMQQCYGKPSGAIAICCGCGAHYIIVSTEVGLVAELVRT